MECMHSNFLKERYRIILNLFVDIFLKLDRIHGARVTEVYQDTPAAHAKLRYNDVILNFDGSRAGFECSRCCGRGELGRDETSTRHTDESDRQSE